MTKKISLILIFSLFLIGCANSSPPSSHANDIKSENVPEMKEQNLPISAKVTLGKEEIELEVTETSQQQQLGLMFRQSLPENRGMLFSFSPPRMVSFWMKNVVIPLDMIFIYDGKIKAIESNVPPCNVDPCPVYGPNALIDGVIELKGGRAKELNLTVGDDVKIVFFNKS